MTVYVDAIFWWPTEQTKDSHAKSVGRRHGGRWCHLFCDQGDEGELHRIAQAIGMRREWFQNRPGFPHYDLVPPRRQAAIAAGAKEMSLSTFIRQKRTKRDP